MSLLKGRNKFYYGVTEDSYVSPEKEKISLRKRKTPLDTFKFTIPDILRANTKIPSNLVPLRFRTSPEDLVELASKVVNKEYIPNPFSWDNLRIRHWIKDLGFPHYMVSIHYTQSAKPTNLPLTANIPKKPYKWKNIAALGRKSIS